MIKPYKLMRKEYRAIPLDYKLIVSDALDKFNTFEIQSILKKHITPAVYWPVNVGVWLSCSDLQISINALF